MYVMQTKRIMSQPHAPWSESLKNLKLHLYMYRKGNSLGHRSNGCVSVLSHDSLFV